LLEIRGNYVTVLFCNEVVIYVGGFYIFFAATFEVSLDAEF